jgi:dimethylaniline monooxygenase (N-oxide forming)
MPISELQSRWVAKVFARQVQDLPSDEVMMKDILKIRKEMANRYVSSQRHTIQVDGGRSFSISLIKQRKD